MFVHLVLLVASLLITQLAFVFSREGKLLLENQSEVKHSYAPTNSESPSCDDPIPEWSDLNCVLGPVFVKSDIAEKAFYELCPEPDTIVPAPKSCDLYLICHGGKSFTVNRCPKSEHFHPLEKRCVGAKRFECSHPALSDPKFILPANFKRQPKNAYKRSSGQLIYQSSRPRHQSNIYSSALGRTCEIEGIYPHPYSCTHFVQCGSGRLFEQSCPEGTRFNPNLLVCDHIRNVNCQTLGRGKRDFVSTINQLLKPLSKANGEHNVLKRSTCNEDYIEPDPLYCNKFLTCSNGRIFTQECGPGTVFNPLSKVCSSLEDVDCKSRILDFGSFDCQEGQYYITSHPEVCNKFVECDMGRIHIKSCPFNLIFDPTNGICNTKDKAECRKPISLENDTDVNYLHSNTRIHRDLSNYECEFNYIAPLDGTCNVFIECENKKLFRKTCGPGTAYNVFLGVCDWPHNVRIPDPKFCSRYLQCDGRKYSIPKSCPSQKYYNPKSGICESIQNIDCKGKLDNPRAQTDYDYREVIQSK